VDGEVLDDQHVVIRPSHAVGKAILLDLDRWTGSPIVLGNFVQGPEMPRKLKGSDGMAKRLWPQTILPIIMDVVST
jgi:hypothetical protein